ncbi:hypothetical protein ACLOJK_029510 [Asimina triloba]
MCEENVEKVIENVDEKVIVVNVDDDNPTPIASEPANSKSEKPHGNTTSASPHSCLAFPSLPFSSFPFSSLPFPFFPPAPVCPPPGPVSPSDLPLPNLDLPLPGAVSLFDLPYQALSPLPISSCLHLHPLPSVDLPLPGTVSPSDLPLPGAVSPSNLPPPGFHLLPLPSVDIPLPSVVSPFDLPMLGIVSPFDLPLLGTVGLVLINGDEVKVERNALSVIEVPIGDEDDDDWEDFSYSAQTFATKTTIGSAIAEGVAAASGPVTSVVTDTLATEVYLTPRNLKRLSDEARPIGGATTMNGEADRTVGAKAEVVMKMEHTRGVLQ